jgi:hypothetical protein
MPRFKIGRKAKPQVAPPATVAPEHKADVMEESFESSEDETQELEHALDELSVRPEPQRPQSRPLTYPEKRPHRLQPTTPAPTQPKRVHFDNYGRPPPHMPHPVYRKPTMPNPPIRPVRGRGKSKISYRSHYGAGGEYLDTRSKAVLLYNHCFG